MGCHLLIRCLDKKKRNTIFTQIYTVYVCACTFILFLLCLSISYARLQYASALKCIVMAKGGDNSHDHDDGQDS